MYFSYSGQIELRSEEARRFKALSSRLQAEAAESAEAFGLPIIEPPYYGAKENAMKRNFEVYGKPIMFFHIAPLGAARFKDLDWQLRATPGGLTNASPQFTNQLDFMGDTLRNVYDRFVDLRDSREIHPHYFVVIDRTDFLKEGVLGIHLDCHANVSEGLQVGVARCHANMAAIWGVSISHNGVEEWERMKNSETINFGPDALHGPAVR